MRTGYAYVNPVICYLPYVCEKLVREACASGKTTSYTSNFVIQSRSLRDYLRYRGGAFESRMKIAPDHWQAFLVTPVVLSNLRDTANRIAIAAPCVSVVRVCFTRKNLALPLSIFRRHSHLNYTRVESCAARLHFGGCVQSVT